MSEKIQDSFFPEVQPLREATRLYVREHGLLRATTTTAELSIAQIHALIEIDIHPKITITDLAEVLRIPLWTMSRQLDKIKSEGFIKVTPEPSDKRQKRLELTPKGQRRVDEMNLQLKTFVNRSLEFVSAEERKTIVLGFQLAANALKHARICDTVITRDFRNKDVDQVIELVKGAFAYHKGELDLYRDFVLEHIRQLGASTARKKSEYLVLEADGRIYGFAGAQPFFDLDTDTAEFKYLFIHPDIRTLNIAPSIIKELAGRMKKRGFSRGYFRALPQWEGIIEVLKSEGFESVKKPEKLHNDPHPIWLLKKL